MGSTSFAGFRWENIATLESGTHREQAAAKFFRDTNWDAVCHAASQLREQHACKLDGQIALGGRHMIRLLRFKDGLAWIARLRLPVEGFSMAKEAQKMELEIDCLQLVKQKSRIPVPEVYGHNLRDMSHIGAPVMFMECLKGNAATDLSFDFIPSEHKPSFLRDMANIQTEIASLQFPKIGEVLKLDNGDFTVGPIPGLGGPFSTAIEFFEAWSAKTEYRQSETTIRNSCGLYGDEVWACTEAFLPKMQRLAHRLSTYNEGPFPLCYGDYGHNNIVVDDAYRVLGVIDWEDAYAAPWETQDFPLILRMVPRPLDAPDNWDENGIPTNPGSIAKLEDRRIYGAAVIDAESRLQTGSQLSSQLGSENSLGLATAMRLFAADGNLAFYSRALDYLES